ncbi:hypothetical protein OOZ19_01030 [Saccharopolyspora sp. NFXS83]|uniref:hypothetical protein n=1 Tax=Saccharopolyspora sp. NFXS83 TaxID=2993560 RepID=UPI00224AD0CB|nr:hypothetical protein [Saccharopolyspora sp. NFXS83]MCX2728812.1 hypothetical protein [Saccharopolyspora sp. NFXS83]
MHELDLDVPSAADLASIEAALPEWDRLLVRDHWESVIAEELGAPQRPALPCGHSDVSSGDRVRARRHLRRMDNTALRRITATVEDPTALGEAA